MSCAGPSGQRAAGQVQLSRQVALRMAADHDEVRLVQTLTQHEIEMNADALDYINRL